MTRRKRTWALRSGLGWIAWVCLPAALAAQPSQERWPGTEACELSSNGGRLTVSARCGTLEVAEDRSAPGGRRIELAWAVVEARTADPEPDPVVFLAGGPGQSAREAAPMISGTLREVNRTRDLIFLDQRGTGGSNPLACEFEEEVFVTEPGIEEVDVQLRLCHAALDAAVEHYTTTESVRDLEELRASLGFERINLVGGSYGTRMAQVYLRLFPDAVRTVVLDGVVPTHLRLGSEHAPNLDRTIEKVLTRCGTEEACGQRFPELDTAFSRLKARHAESPEMIRITHPRTGAIQELEFNDRVLASSLRFLAYSPVTQAVIPYLIHEAATTGQANRLAAQALITTEEIGGDLAIGLNFSVGCSEDWPTWPTSLDHSSTLLGDSFTELFDTVCAWWPADPVGPEFHRPFDSEVPVLALSGEYDPVTPPEYGAEAARQFSNSLHLVSPGLGHITLTHPCIGAIIAEFVLEGSVEELDTECMGTIGPEPFFLDLLGPTP